MKTLSINSKPTIRRCLNFSHLSLVLALSLSSASVLAFEISHKVAISRAPASAFDEEVLTVPLEKKEISETLFAEDDAGVMRGMRESLASWERTEEYAKNWHLESTGLYKTPTTEVKSQFISKNLLRYADKRLAGEMKNAQEGSTLYSMSKVEKSLRPNASVPVSKYISLKFKARVLQGKAIIEVKNPWIDCSGTISASGKTKILTKKDFAQLGTTTGFEYNINEAQWVAFVDQEVTKNIKARLSSTSQVNGNDADKRIEMNASFPFNL